jgi:hypothetical protein
METFKSTYEKTQDLIDSGNKKNIFDTINSLGEISETLMMFIKDCSTTFCQDIATKTLEKINNTTSNSGRAYVSLSDKQAWCLTFELLKIQHQMSAWIEREIELSK